MALHNDLGTHGEALACNFLIKKGFEILDQNWTHGKSEVDIIACKDGVIVFVEVKTRSSDLFGEPQQFVNDAKIDQLATAANAYIQIMEHAGEVRFDILSVSLVVHENYRIEHFEDAFWPEP